MSFYVNPFERIDHQDVFFTSDIHIGHQNVIGFDSRPFKDLDEMHEEMIIRWNYKVPSDAIVYLVGDVSYRCNNMGLVKDIMKQLNGDIRLILGNHDRMKEMAKLGVFSDIQSYKRLEILHDDGNNGDRQDVVLCHYPILSWDKEFHGAIHLHGHCHQNLKDKYPWYYEENKVIDVGCMGHNYEPISYQEVKKLIIV